ncbi:DHA2 family efflux MFS transporter permease subunit [Actinomadura parmotrematis]|uniref:DHA2 family efflux MFS transporter permease subunit n=1 Tax=Actinomadura parmotrematis TaxID=2864039 RepID=A0ABS7G4F3_9ACTN|nr:DHA2 family efflux MFS transporter permease subunit [Actinomadura parmotrematis]MBW8487255.1 DHA2 family efflux MFS transporter permease subunit [Actinomadura parmotrematis]
MTHTVTAPAQDARLGPEIRRLAVVVVLGAFMTVLDSTIVNVAVTTLGQDFDTSLSTIQWVLTGYTLALSMTIPLTGWAVRRFGPRRMWLASLVLFAAGSVLCGLAWSVPALIAFRVLQGIGGGMIMPVGQTMLARAAGPDRMGRVMSVVAVPAMIAPVLGPLVGGGIVDHLSWRWLFYVNVPFCAAALAAAVLMLPRDTERDASARLDVAGLALLSPGLAALVYGLAQAGDGVPLSGARFLVPVLAGAALVAGFVAHALRKRERALVDLRALRSRSFIAMSGGAFVYCLSLFGLMVLVPLYAQIVRGDTPLESGWLLAPLGLGAMVTMPVSGRLTDRLGQRPLAVAGTLLVLAGAALLATVDPGTGRLAIMGMGLVVGLGHGTAMPAVQAAFYRGLPRDAVPAATTASNILIRVGSSFGTAVTAVVLQIMIRDGLPGASGNLREAAAAHRPDLLSDAFTGTFWCSAALLAVAVLPMLAIPRKGR